MAANLNPLEYVNARGEVRSVLQLFCDCEEADLLGDDLACGRADWGRVERVLLEIDDRIRFVWPGGALHLGLAGTLPPLLLASAAAVSAYSLPALVLALLGLPTLAYFVYQHLRRLRRRNGFFLSWTLSSLVLCAVVYMSCFSDRIDPLINVLNVALFVVTVASLGLAMEGPDVLDQDACPELRKSARAHRCKVTGFLVARYDHYCPWVGCSVGKGNHRAYVAFLVSLLITCVHAGSCVAQRTSAPCPHAGIELGPASGLAACFATGESSLSLAFVAYVWLVALAVGSLLVAQLCLISQGITTYERRHVADIEYTVPQNKQLLRNTLAFFCQ